MKTLEVVTDLREAFLCIIFKGYPDHKIMWSAEEVSKAFTSAMYDVAVDYYDRIDGKK